MNWDGASILDGIVVPIAHISSNYTQSIDYSEVTLKDHPSATSMKSA